MNITGCQGATLWLSGHACLCAQTILPKQRLLAEESSWEAVLAVVRDEEVCDRLRGRWQRDQGRLTSGDNSCERWAELCAEVDKVMASVPCCQLSGMH